MPVDVEYSVNAELDVLAVKLSDAEISVTLFSNEVDVPLNEVISTVIVALDEAEVGNEISVLVSVELTVLLILEESCGTFDELSESVDETVALVSFNPVWLLRTVVLIDSEPLVEILVSVDGVVLVPLDTVIISPSRH